MQDLDGLKDFAKRQFGLDVKVGCQGCIWHCLTDVPPITGFCPFTAEVITWILSLDLYLYSGPPTLSGSAHVDIGSHLGETGHQQRQPYVHCGWKAGHGSALEGCFSGPGIRAHGVICLSLGLSPESVQALLGPPPLPCPHPPALLSSLTTPPYG